jgi:hypothetical protein
MARGVSFQLACVPWLCAHHSLSNFLCFHIRCFQFISNLACLPQSWSYPFIQRPWRYTLSLFLALCLSLSLSLTHIYIHICIIYLSICINNHEFSLIFLILIQQCRAHSCFSLFIFSVVFYNGKNHGFSCFL